jgi:hypothetical protein
VLLVGGAAFRTIEPNGLVRGLGRGGFPDGGWPGWEGVVDQGKGWVR